uniref:Ribosome biogenesis protein NOP53 n=1 Tax=Cacopsylla melanoneura TaxID=428564 RepID=A0A8D8Q6Y6_9HEMI
MTARKRVSKKLKKSWRKNCDTTDVDQYLDNKRLEERLGKAFSERSNEALFTIDVRPDSGHEPSVMLSSAQRKKKALQPAKCFQSLEITTGADDPIVKRNIITSERRLKEIAEKAELKQNTFKRKDLLALKQRRETITKGKRKKRNFESRLRLAKEVWDCKEDPIESNPDVVDPQWISQEAKDHYLKLTPYRRMNVPRSISSRPNQIASVQLPHPGMSYNPSLEDHQDLLQKVAAKEEAERKREEHLDRVTSAMFTRMSKQETEKQWMEEMSQGIEDKVTLDQVKLAPHEIKEEEAPNSNEYSTVNPPVDGERQRSLQARRREREEKKKQKELKLAKVEKKKLADIYKLRFISKDIDKFEGKIQHTEEKRQKKIAMAPFTTKRVGKNKFEEPDLEFSLYQDLTGSLRTVQPEGRPLTERFTSFAQRNIMEPTKKQTKKTVPKAKTYIKTDHRIPELAKIKDMERRDAKRFRNRNKKWTKKPKVSS